MNLVVNQASSDGDLEFCFPCAPYQLVAVLNNQTFRTETVDGQVVVQREEDNVTAAFTSASGGVEWRHSVPLEPFACALMQVAPEADRFVA